MKTINQILTIITLGALTIGCGVENSGGGNDVGSKITDPEKIKTALVGTWEETDLGGQYIFTAGGKVTEVSSLGANTFDWKLSEDGKTITMGLDLTVPDACSTITLDSITEKSFTGGVITPLNERPLPVTYKKIKSAETNEKGGKKGPAVEPKTNAPPSDPKSEK